MPVNNDQMDIGKDSLIWVIAIAVIPISSLAGLAARMREDTELTKLEIASALLNSGLLGFVVFCLGAHYWGTESLFLLVGVSVMSGLGGNTAIDMLKEIVRKKITGSLKSDE